MSETDVHAILKTVLCSQPGCPDDAETGFSRCRRHRAEHAERTREWRRTRSLRPIVKPDDDVYWLKHQECAREIRVSVRTIQRLVAEGHLEALQLPGGMYRISRAAWSEFLRRNTRRTS